MPVMEGQGVKRPPPPPSIMVVGGSNVAYYDPNPAAKRPRIIPPAPPTGIMHDWLVAQELLDGLQQAVSQTAGRTVVFDARHRSILREWFMRSVPEFWRSLDQIYETMMRAEWRTIRDDVRFVQSLLSHVPKTPRERLSPALRSMLRSRYGPEADIVVPDLSDPLVAAPSAYAIPMAVPFGGPALASPPPMPMPMPAGGWETAAEAMTWIERRVSERAGRRITFDTRHRDSLRATFNASPVDFWTIIDQVYEKMMRGDWRKVREDGGFMQSIIAHSQPLPTQASEYQLRAALFEKLGAPLPALPVPAGPAVPVLPPTPGVLQMPSAVVGRRIELDSKHRDALRRRYERDRLGFWSVLDQIQDRMVQSDWTDVRNDARFVQSWLGRFDPVEQGLSDFMSSLLPPHPALQTGMPPHLAAAHGNTPREPQLQLLLQQQQQQQLQLPVETREQRGREITWEFVKYVLRAIERRVARQCSYDLTFDQKHMHSLRELYDQERDKAKFVADLDVIQETLIKAEWATIRDPGRYVQSVFFHHAKPAPELSSFMSCMLNPTD
eukprot:m51a1_g3975 hypothetical protein (553) ;mRNA; r:429204-431865